MQSSQYIGGLTSNYNIMLLYFLVIIKITGMTY